MMPYLENRSLARNCARACFQWSLTDMHCHGSKGGWLQSMDTYFMHRIRHTQAPYGWRHAALHDVKAFLKEEAKKGFFHPKFEGGLD